MKKQLPINCAGRLALWIYSRVVVSRFSGAPTVIEEVRSYEAPDFDALPEQSDIELELWGGAIKLRLDGELGRIYTERFKYVSYASEKEARAALFSLWKRIELLESIDEVRMEIAAWREIIGERN